MASVRAVLRAACHSVNQATERRPGSVRTSLTPRTDSPRPMIAATGQAKKTVRNASGTAASTTRVVRLNALPALGRSGRSLRSPQYGLRPGRDPLVAVRGDVL